MQVRIKGQDQAFTLLTIVSESSNTGVFAGTTVRAMAYVYDKDRKVTKFPADDIEKVEK